MLQTNINIISNNKLNLELLYNLEKKPGVFSAGAEQFWDDPHISQKMLEAHLNPDWDAASYNHKTIRKIVEWLVSYLNLKEGAKILDLGCGPGLYCSQFYQHGLDVTGMDYSRNSIDYAIKYADTNCLNIQYIYQNYLTMDYCCEFDAIFLIYCDFGALSDSSRDILLQKIQKALKPDGIFVFDVFTRFKWEEQTIQNWHVSQSGFWRPEPHLVLEQNLHYEEENVYLNQHTIIDNTGKVTTYNLWDHYYSKETISNLMKVHGYHVQDVWSGLTGKTYEESTKCLGVVAKKL